MEEKQVVYGTSYYSRPLKIESQVVHNEQTEAKLKSKMKLKKNGFAEIALTGYVNAGEILEIGKNRIEYMAVESSRGFDGIYPKVVIQKMHGYEINKTDILNAKIDAKIKFLNRMSPYEHMEIFFKVNYDENIRCNNEL